MLVKCKISKLFFKIIAWGLVFENSEKKKSLFLKKDFIIILLVIILLYLFTKYIWNYNLFDIIYAEEIEKKQEIQPSESNDFSLFKKILILISICLGIGFLVKYGFEISSKIDNLNQVVRHLELKNDFLMHYINDVAKKSFDVLEKQVNNHIDEIDVHSMDIDFIAKKLDALAKIVVDLVEELKD